MCPICVLRVLVSGPGLWCSLRCRTGRLLWQTLQVYTHCLYCTAWYTARECVCGLICFSGGCGATVLNPVPFNSLTEGRMSRAALRLPRDSLQSPFCALVLLLRLPSCVCVCARTRPDEANLHLENHRVALFVRSTRALGVHPFQSSPGRLRRLYPRRSYSAPGPADLVCLQNCSKSHCWCCLYV